MKVAVIGGGPAGMIAAGFASSNGHDVTIYDKNKKLGKKLLITGKGRCNITNSSDISDFFDQIPTNKEFMYSSFYSFDNNQILSLLKNYGLDTKIERGNRVFPVSDRSMTVLETLIEFLKDKKVNIRLNKDLKTIKKVEDRFNLSFKDGAKESFDKVILAAGGTSYPVTGSNGDGYSLARSLGHNIIDPRPALVPINLNNLIGDLQGLSLKNCELTSYINGRKYKSEFGELLFTHFGISGPIVLTLSSYLNKFKKDEISLKLDLKPALSFKELDDRILRDFSDNTNKALKNSLDKLLPKKMIDPIIEESGIDQYKVVHQITQEERHGLVRALKEYPLDFASFRSMDEAIVSSGGVDVIEIDPSTMESKKVEGLYFAGEIIDVDGLTGGYNLQIAYSTGYLAGSSI